MVNFMNFIQKKKLGKNVIFPDFQLSEKTRPGKVVLKVVDMKEMVQFYRDVIGLKLFENNEERSILGAGQTPLLQLQKINNPLPLTQKTGLYHVAFLLPTRKDLGNALYHYVVNQAPVIGGSDHGYSESIYLTDPEGNGIEVYRDKPVDQWDIRDDGEIVGITKEMDAQGVIDGADRDWYGFPAETKVGHVHLKVAKLQPTETFYTDSLGLSLKNNFGSEAKFFATGNYHHHIGSNIWMSKDTPAMEENDLGLAYFSFYVENHQELDRLESHWQEKKLSYQKDKKGNLWITDPNGIEIKFEITPVIHE